MLVLTRRINDRVKLYCRGVEITVIQLGDWKIAFEAPAEVQILREEVEMRPKPTGEER